MAILEADPNPRIDRQERDWLSHFIYAFEYDGDRALEVENYYGALNEYMPIISILEQCERAELQAHWTGMVHLTLGDAYSAATKIGKLAEAERALQLLYRRKAYPQIFLFLYDRAQTADDDAARFYSKARAEANRILQLDANNARMHYLFGLAIELLAAPTQPPAPLLPASQREILNTRPLRADREEHCNFRRRRAPATYAASSPVTASMTTDSNTADLSPTQSVANAIVDGIRDGKLELPVIPQVASRIFSLTNDPNADMSELSKLIHGDQSIASHVLRIANSASYTSGEPIVSLQQAVTRLGMKLLGEIAIAVSIQSDTFKAPGFEALIKGLLKHALASAAYGREIARKRRRNVEGQFLCGLLHSVGKPICLQLIAKVQKAKAIELSPEDVAQIVGTLHQKIATKVAIDWKLPKQLQVTTVFYRKYEGAPAFKDECAATYLCQLLASWAVNPAKYNIIEMSKDPVIEFLNFYQDDFQDLLQKKDDVKAVVAAMEL